MSYQAHYINPLIQFGRAEFDLILEDESGVLPTLRIGKQFSVDVTQAELDAEAALEIERATHQQSVSVDSVVDLPDGVTIE